MGADVPQEVGSQLERLGPQPHNLFAKEAENHAGPVASGDRHEQPEISLSAEQRDDEDHDGARYAVLQESQRLHAHGEPSLVDLKVHTARPRRVRKHARDLEEEAQHEECNHHSA